MPLAIGEAVWRKLRGPGTGPRGGHGPDRGPPLFESMVVLGRDEMLRRIAAALAARRRSDAPRTAQLALRLKILVVLVVVLYVGVTFVQVWLTSRRTTRIAADAILVLGAAEDDCVPAPDLQARLERALTLYHRARAAGRADRRQAAGRQVHRGASRVRRGSSSRTACRRRDRAGGGEDSCENIADAAPALQARGGTRCWSSPTPSTRTGRWRSSRPTASRRRPTPTQNSPIHGLVDVPYFIKESVEGRSVGSSATTTGSGCRTSDATWRRLPAA